MGAKRQILYFLCISLMASSCFGSWFKKDYSHNPRMLALVNQEVQATRLAYNNFFQQSLVSQMQNGAGRTPNFPIVIPPIYGNNQFAPGGMYQTTNMLEPVARSIAYAGLFCEGIGFVNKAAAQPLYINFVSLITKPAQGFGGMATVFGGQAGITVEITRITTQCKDFLPRLCVNGACSSGKCGQSKVLGSFCDELCQGSYSGDVRNCRNDFYRLSAAQEAVIPGTVMWGGNMPSVPPIQSYVPPIQSYFNNSMQPSLQQEQSLFYGQQQMDAFMGAQQNMSNYPQSFANQGYY